MGKSLVSHLLKGLLQLEELIVKNTERKNIALHGRGRHFLDKTNRQHHCYCLIKMRNNRIAVQQHKLEAPYTADGAVK